MEIGTIPVWKFLSNNFVHVKKKQTKNNPCDGFAHKTYHCTKKTVQILLSVLTFCQYYSLYFSVFLMASILSFEQRFLANFKKKKKTPLLGMDNSRYIFYAWMIFFCIADEFLERVNSDSDYVGECLTMFMKRCLLVLRNIFDFTMCLLYTAVCFHTGK